MTQQPGLRRCPRHPDILVRPWELCPEDHLPPWPNWLIIALIISLVALVGLGARATIDGLRPLPAPTEVPAQTSSDNPTLTVATKAAPAATALPPTGTPTETQLPPTRTPSPSSTPTVTPSSTPTVTATRTATASFTPTGTPTPTRTPTSTRTATRPPRPSVRCYRGAVTDKWNLTGGLLREAGGQVLDVFGKPAQGIMARIHIEDYWSAYFQTGADGMFSWPALYQPWYSITLVGADVRSDDVRVDIENGKRIIVTFTEYACSN
jgi:hypothetical protein